MQNVAENLEGALVTFGEGQAERAGYECSVDTCVALIQLTLTATKDVRVLTNRCVTRTSSFDSLVGEESPTGVVPR